MSQSGDLAPVALVGAGSIGLGWAVVFARAGRSVRLYDIEPDARAGAPEQISRRLDALHANALLDEPADEILARVVVVDTPDKAVADASWVQECAIESRDVKRELFRQLDRLAPPGVVLASSTSMISASRWAADVDGRERCLVVHPGNPPYLLPIAEIVPAPFTSEATISSAEKFLRGVGMLPVLVRGEPEGFVFNRLQGALLREAYCLVRDGVVSPADIDRVVTAGPGRRWAVLGPFATAHLNTRGGIRRHAAVMGPAYARMGAERGQHDPWTDDLVSTVADDLAGRFPLEQWEGQVLERDAALMQFERVRRTASSPFARLGSGLADE
jgi:3-hydroxyacyl-CoA dehydrogenase